MVFPFFIILQIAAQDCFHYLYLYYQHFFKTSLYVFDLIVSFVHVLHVSIPDKNQHALSCSFPKQWKHAVSSSLQPPDGTPPPPSGLWGVGGVCARDSEQWPNC